MRLRGARLLGRPAAPRYNLPAMARPQVVLRDTEHGRWEMVTAAPHVSLRAHVRQYVGGVERLTDPIRRRELPGSDTPVIINLGEPIRLFEAGDSTRWTDYGSFATGPYDSYVVIESTGTQRVIQINFTVLGARLFLGCPLRGLRNRAVELEDVFGPSARRLTLQLYDAPTWDDRFDILDREIGARIAAARAPADEVLWAWRRIVERNGRIRIGPLAGETGWSQKHLIARFKEDIGLSPKVLARVLRFGSAVRRLRRERGIRLTDVALDCGYYDHAHFDRDFRAFAGVAPAELVRSLMPDGGFTLDRKNVR